mmetsp:Transcript_16531/g.24519  ORF Transcript_16531/g.24519 Transcript_16531/m.24519 type:complete len:436 (+) Transcript_16531:66-1373(+)
MDTNASSRNCACGVPKSSVCLCQQLSRPSNQERARTLWLGSVDEHENEDDLAKLFVTLVGVEGPHVTIRRKRWTNEDGRKQGFALIRFKSEAEATQVLSVWSGNRPLRAHKWERTPTVNPTLFPTKNSSQSCRTISNLHPSEQSGMPSLELQLEPLTETQLRNRLSLLGYPSCAEEEAKAMATGGRLAKKAFLKQSLADVYRSNKVPRRLRFARGVPIPEPYLNTMMDALESLQWRRRVGESRARKGVDAEQYLVLGRSSAEQPQSKAERIAPQHAQVWAVAMDLLSSILRTSSGDNIDGSNCCELYEPTSLVVSKNFKGSPHIDARDVTWQYAAAFGDYSYESSNKGDVYENGEEEERSVDDALYQGGELCVESELAGGAEVILVDTRNRLARVDGRYPHWVRQYNVGCRYSLIWYRVAGQGTDPQRAVYDTLL